MSERNIEDILHFRRDLSPFLVHLTRDYKNRTAKENLVSILSQKQLTQNEEHVSDVRLSKRSKEASEKNDLKPYLNAISFTETPLSEVHCLFDIRGREVNLKPYGLVFLKNRLQNRGVSPVLYINNWDDHAKFILDELATLMTQSSQFSHALERLFPLFSVFGKRIYPPKKDQSPHLSANIDFSWEREWRYPYKFGHFMFSEEDDLFCGLCPHDEISFFKGQFPKLNFIDPLRPPAWYSKDLVKRRKELEMDHSVV